GEHISDTERRSMMAERDTTDRYMAAYLSERVGNEFTGRISGIARFGVFVKLDETGAEGLIPMRSIGREYFHYDAEAGTLMGADTGMLISLGQRVTVRLAEAVPVTGGIALELLEIDGDSVPQGRTSPAGRSPRRNRVKAKRKADKTKRKVRRSRR
ncbi:MAG: S1 RNA-binding domain-containing protein, partial [Pseudomonadota bacterium]